VTLLTIRADASLDRLLPFLATGEISAQDLMLGIKQDDWELALDKLQQAAKENVMPRLVAEVEDLRQKSELEREILAHDTVPELKAVQEVRQ
jgi:L-2-hydroxyglutarate oxidase LhgO